MKILGIETTCDETGAAIVEDGRKLLSFALASSAIMQKKYGGVVPEIAAREQVRCIIPIIEEALGENTLCEIDAISVANGPGLIGSLLIGVETAKALALSLRKPLIPVNHLEAHIYANWLEDEAPQFPVLGLVVSGGHTSLVYLENHKKFKLIGSTLDDAAGEAFDKAAKLLGLPYPGGPEVEKVAEHVKISKSQNVFPRPMIDSGNLDFSFSGLKTSLVNYVNKKSDGIKGDELFDVCFEFQEAICDVLVYKTRVALKKFPAKSVAVGGGVAANKRLRAKMLSTVKKEGVKVFFPSHKNSVDNGAMIAACAFFTGKRRNPLTVQANPSLHF